MATDFLGNEVADTSGASVATDFLGNPIKKKKSGPLKGVGNFLKTFGKDAATTVEHVPAGALGLAEGVAGLPKFALDVASGKRGDELASADKHTSNVFKGTAQMLRNTGATLLPLPKSAKSAISQFSEAPSTNFSQHPFSAITGEAALLAPGLGKLAAVGDTASAGVQGATLAERLGNMSALQKAAYLTGKVAEAPIAPFKALAAAPGALGKLAEGSLAAEDAGNGSAFTGAKALVKLSPAVQAIKDEAGRLKAYTRAAQDPAHTQVFDNVISDLNKRGLGDSVEQVKQAAAQAPDATDTDIQVAEKVAAAHTDSLDRMRTSPLSRTYEQLGLSAEDRTAPPGFKQLPTQNPQTGRFVFGGPITPDSVFMPSAAVDELKNFLQPAKSGSGVARLLGTGNRAFYATRLAMNPAFITGRVFGHAMLGIASSSDPIALGKNLFKVYGDWKDSGGSFTHLLKTGEDTGEFVGGPQLHGSAATEAERTRMAEDALRPSRAARTKLGQSDTKAGEAIRVADKTGKIGSKILAQGTKRQYALASFMDNMQRSAYYLTELGKSGSEEAAMTATLRALGNFDRLTPFEQNTVRQIIPMYAWHKELTRIAFHLAEDHPLRVAWTMYLANAFGKPSSPLSDYNQNSVPAGKELVGTGLLNPFAEVTSSLGGGLGGLGKLLGPVPRLAANFLTHENTSTGKDWFRPPGTPTVAGHAAAPSIFRQLRPMIPQFRLLDSLTGKDKSPQYASGETFTPSGSKGSDFLGGSSEPGLQKSSLLESVSGFLGIPLTNKTEAEAEEQATLARQLKKLTADQKKQLAFLIQQQGQK